jgi:septum site-determining protein MinC
MIKGNKYGFTIYLDPDMEFDSLLTQVGERFAQSSRFFSGDSQVAVRFEGRKMSLEETNQIIEQMEENSDIHISYIMDDDEKNEAWFKEAVEEYGHRLRRAFDREKEEYKAELLAKSRAEKEQENKMPKDGQFYRGTLRSGQAVEVDHSIVIVGDVNPGSDVVAGGNIVILGCLKGSVSAGFPDDRNAFVVALDMQPMQIRIGDLIARSPDNDPKPKKKKKDSKETEAKIAYVEEESIYIEPISRALMNEINTLS